MRRTRHTIRICLESAIRCKLDLCVQAMEIFFKSAFRAYHGTQRPAPDFVNFIFTSPDQAGESPESLAVKMVFKQLNIMTR